MAGTPRRGRFKERSIARALLAAFVALGLIACSERTSAPHVRASAPLPVQNGEADEPDMYEVGLEAGREQGYADGHREGLDEGYDKGLDVGRDEGRSAALDCVRQHAATTAAEAADLCE